MAENTTSRSEPRKKRKRKDETSHAIKKSRKVAVASPGAADFQAQALQLEEEILESRTNYNSIHTLLEYLQQSSRAENEKIIVAVALFRVFCRLMAGGNLAKRRESSGNEATIVEWLRERLQDYEQGLLRMLKNDNIGTQSTALTLVVRLVKADASYLNQSEDAISQDSLFGQLVRTLIEEGVADEIRAEFVDKYVNNYDDVRYYTFASLAYVLSPSRSDTC